MDNHSVGVNFAYDLFEYLFVKFELGAQLNDNYFKRRDQTEFNEDIGEAVLVLSYTYRVRLRARFRDSISQIAMSDDHYRCYVKAFVTSIYNDQYMWEFLVILAFMSELAVFCYFRGLEDIINCTPEFFGELFDQQLKNHFYETGGWEQLNTISKPLANGYRKMKDIVDFEHPEVQKNISNTDLNELFNTSASDSTLSRDKLWSGSSFSTTPTFELDPSDESETSSVSSSGFQRTSTPACPDDSSKE